MDSLLIQNVDEFDAPLAMLDLQFIWRFYVWKYKVQIFYCSTLLPCIPTASVLLVLVLALYWCLSGAFEKREFSSGSSAAQLWLACMVGPFGVWMRWFLARLNGRGLGKNGYLNWVPFGTLIANVLAACIMAVLAELKKVVKTQLTYDTVSFGLEFGLMGCLSTVSTFAAEFHAMRQ